MSTKKLLYSYNDNETLSGWTLHISLIQVSQTFSKREGKWQCEEHKKSFSIRYAFRKLQFYVCEWNAVSGKTGDDEYCDNF